MFALLKFFATTSTLGFTGALIFGVLGWFFPSLYSATSVSFAVGIISFVLCGAVLVLVLIFED